MQKKSKIPYLKGKNASYVSLMYKNNTTAMILALPNDKKMDIISSFDLHEILSTNKNTSNQVNLKMPKFKIEYKNSLVKHFK